MSDNRGDEPKTTRRTTLKAITGAAASLALGTGVASAASDSGSGTTDDVSVPETASERVEHRVTKYDDSLRSITNSPHLLTLSEDAIDRHFEHSTLEGREFEDARQYVRALRKRYPVEQVRTDEEVHYVLSDEAKRNLATDRRRTRPLLETESHLESFDSSLPTLQSTRDLTAHGNATGVFGDLPAGQTTEVSELWTPTHHETILEKALEDIDSSEYCYIFAGEPDDFNEMANGRLGLQDGNLDAIDTPFGVGEDWVESTLGGILKTVIDKTFKNYTQYHDPDAVTINVPKVGDIELSGVGMAPVAAETFYQLAGGASGYDKQEYMGWASHYLHDMAMPLHTGFGLEQANITWDVDVGLSLPPADIDVSVNPKYWIHYGAESLAKHYWTNTFNYNYYYTIGPFEDDFSGTNEEDVYSGSQAAIDMAEFSSQYSDDVYHTILENESGNRWRSEGDWSEGTVQTVLGDFESCFEELGRYQRGFLTSRGYGD